MDDLFTACLKVTLAFEGGTVDNPADHGGLTKWGITQQTYAFFRRSTDQPVQPVSKMTSTEMVEIYRRYFYAPSRCFLMPAVWAMMVFDSAVLCNPEKAINWAQEALGVDVDGLLGPQTYSAMRKLDSETFNKFCGLRSDFHKQVAADNPKQGEFLKGWLNRVNTLRLFAMRSLASGAEPLPPFEVQAPVKP